MYCAKACLRLPDRPCLWGAPWAESRASEKAGAAPRKKGREKKPALAAEEAPAGGRPDLFRRIREAAEKRVKDGKRMKREKSCGALVIRKNGESYDLVLLRHRFGGHWSFPKGHVEAGETERQTALREVKEETGLTIRLYDGFRESVEYFPQAGVKKQVVYFLGEALGDELVRQEEEISELRWAPLLEAGELVTFANDKRLIRLAKKRLGILSESPAVRRPARRPRRGPKGARRPK